MTIFLPANHLNNQHPTDTFTKMKLLSATTKIQTSESVNKETNIQETELKLWSTYIQKYVQLDNHMTVALGEEEYEDCARYRDSIELHRLLLMQELKALKLWKKGDKKRLSELEERVKAIKSNLNKELKK